MVAVRQFRPSFSRMWVSQSRTALGQVSRRQRFWGARESVQATGGMGRGEGGGGGMQPAAAGPLRWFRIRGARSTTCGGLFYTVVLRICVSFGIIAPYLLVLGVRNSPFDLTSILQVVEFEPDRGTHSFLFIEISSRFSCLTAAVDW